MSFQRKVSRREFVKSVAVGSALASVASELPLASGVEKPNIVYIFSDQQHWRALGCQDPFFDTPHQDAFASDAVLFDRSFCTTPQCSPSRSSMLTGLYPSKTGVMGNVGSAGGDPLKQRGLGHMLQEAGYNTTYYGKWHLGDDSIGAGGWNQEGWKLRDSETTVSSVEFLSSAQAQKGPFGLVASYLDPHDIYHFGKEPDFSKSKGVSLPESWEKESFTNKPVVQKQFMTDDQGTAIWGESRELWQFYREFYRQKVKLYDDAVGEILQALKENGLWEKTIVILSSDHGDMDTNHKLIFKGPFMYEHMVRVPMVIRVPKAFGGTRRGRVNDFDAVSVDLVPTIRDFVGLEPLDCDGVSLKGLLAGGTSPQRDYVIGQYFSKQKWVNPIRMIRTSEFKFNRYIEHGDELYDLVNDPNELVNLANDAGYQKKKNELLGELNQWIENNNDPFYSLKTVPLKA